MKDQHLEKLLKKIGLQKEMTIEGSSNAIFNPERFTRYIIRLPKTDYQREMDDIYRISDEWVMHKPTGLRMHFAISESYFGDTETYKCYSAFVITKSGKEIQVLDMDLVGGCFITEEGKITFAETDKNLSGSVIRL